MPIVDIVQRSEKWHKWRSLGITASMIPIIMGCSPYKTPYELWAEMVGLKEPDDLSDNYHVQRGVEQEPEARDAVEREYGRPYLPVCVEADHNPLFRASLDGLYIPEEEREVLEIKCPCKKIYFEILEKKSQAPTFIMYAAQTQWQMNCSNAKQARLYFYLRGNRPVSTLIRRNQGFIEKAEKAALHFWNLVQTKQPPEMIEGRDKVVYDTPIAKTDTAWLAKVEQYKSRKEEYARVSQQLSAIDDDVKRLESYFTEQIPSDVQTFNKDGIRATRVEKDGSIDIKALIEALQQEMNITVPSELIEKCRKKGSTYYRVTVQETPKDKGVALEPYVPDVESVALSQASAPVVQQEIKQTVSSELVENPVRQEQESPEVEQVVPEYIQPLQPSTFMEDSTRRMYF
ncbi:lambda-exonuclease family protein [Vibrio coralliilyticus]|uniref:YqaJ viral recombinase domain-containing protein n=1 Tax=Vibrio coralliilyticus TaxID=190893 RepID=A0AAP7DG50_9VIBR|nr:YqaJ viral recombinase family protein [Vibrio coralliilyticus]NOI32246.1 hypothetical protein [Vibrio coralliilyticus]NOJ25330.1 hypothetical protein [Vibrio coralliilyticus]